MSKNTFHMHFVATHEEAQKFAGKKRNFWVSNCGCREQRLQEEKKHCARSRRDVCLYFTKEQSGNGSDFRKIDRAAVDALFRLAEEARLVTRPFRNEEHPENIDGICFCCDDCCGYLNGDEEACDSGQLVERTDHERCTACGQCVDACYFKARELADDALLVHRSKCKGCGLCLEVCSSQAIEMMIR